MYVCAEVLREKWKFDIEVRQQNFMSVENLMDGFATDFAIKFEILDLLRSIMRNLNQISAFI